MSLGKDNDEGMKWERDERIFKWKRVCL